MERYVGQTWQQVALGLVACQRDWASGSQLSGGSPDMPTACLHSANTVLLTACGRKAMDKRRVSENILDIPLDWLASQELCKALFSSDGLGPFGAFRAFWAFSGLLGLFGASARGWSEAAGAPCRGVQAPHRRGWQRLARGAGHLGHGLPSGGEAPELRFGVELLALEASDVSGIVRVSYRD